MEVQELRNLVAGEVENDEATLERFSRDASMFQVRPKLVIAPKNVADIKAVVNYVSQRPGFSLTPSAGRSDMSGGVLTESIVLDFARHLNRLKKIEGKLAVVEPGMYWRDFEKETLKHNLLMPSYPASRELCAVGGMVGNNAGGEKTLAYGKTEDYVATLRAVLADGNEYEFRPLNQAELDQKMAQTDFEGNLYRQIYNLIEKNYERLQQAKPKVTKNSAGYYLWNVWNREQGIFDLTRLLTGSQGTLGIITEIGFRLITPPSHKKLLVIFLRDSDHLAEIVNEVLKFKPESFESYDDKTLRLVFSYFGGFVKTLGAKNVFKLVLKFWPEAKMVASGGLPKLVLLAEFTGEEESGVAERAAAAAAAVRPLRVRTHLVGDELEAKKYWTIRREAFNLLRSHLKKKRSVPFIDDLIVRPEKLPQFLPRLNATLRPYREQMSYAIGGHSGDGNLHIYSIVDIHNPKVRAVIPEILRKVHNLTLEFHGSLTAEHNDGLIRSPFLEQMYGAEIYRLFEETKRIFDPKGIFNPGKKVGATLEYALWHIAP